MDVCGLQWMCWAQGTNGCLAQHVAAYEILSKLSSVELLTNVQARQLSEGPSPYGWHIQICDTDGVAATASNGGHSSANLDRHPPSSDLLESIKVRDLHISAHHE